MKAEFSSSTKMLIQLHYSRLSEKERRPYAALESMKLGHGGITYISKVLGVSRGTIIYGRKEFLTDSLQQARQRKEGGGRKKTVSHPEIQDLYQLYL